MTHYFAPYPCSVQPQVLAAQAIPPVSAAAVSENELADRMKEFFFTDADQVCFFPCTREGLYQMAISWFTGRKILILVNGPMSQEWYDMALDCHADVGLFDIAYGSPVNTGLLSVRLQEEKWEAVMLVETDVFTASHLNIGGLSGLIRSNLPETKIIVDVSGSIFSSELHPLGKTVDVYLCGSDMALGLPSGLGITAMSLDAHTHVISRSAPEWYFNYAKQNMNRRGNKLYAAAPYQLLNALNCQIDLVLIEGLQERIERAAALQNMLDRWLQGHRFENAVPAALRAVNITAVSLPEQFTADGISDYLKRYGLYIGNGMGEWTGNTILISHANDVQAEDLSSLLHALERFLSDYDTRSIHFRLRSRE